MNKYEQDLIPSYNTIDKEFNIKTNEFNSDQVFSKIQKEKEEELTDQDIDFLKNVCKIKIKIDSLNLEINEIYKKNKNLKDYTEELEELKIMIHQCNETVDTCNDKYRGLVMKKYNDALLENLLCSGMSKYEEAEEYATLKTNIEKPEIPKTLLNKENMNQINSINVILEKNKNTYSEAEYKICEILEKIKMLKKIISTDDITKNEPFQKILCSVCNEKQIEFCMDPCGHCVCKDCSKKILTKCHTCKVGINNKIKLNNIQFPVIPNGPTTIGSILDSVNWNSNE